MRSTASNIWRLWGTAFGQKIIRWGMGVSDMSLSTMSRKRENRRK